MSRASKRITINVDGIPRTLFSIAERPNGDVYIIHRAFGAFSPMVSHAGSAIADATLNIELGFYNPSYFTIVASVFVCAPNYHLMEGDGRDFTVKQIPFGKCKLVVLWSYLSLGSLPGFYTLHAGTKPPEGSEKFYNPGFDPHQAMALFETQRELIRREFISRSVNLPPEIQEVIFYARTPDIDSPEFLQALLAKRVAKDIREKSVALLERRSQQNSGSILSHCGRKKTKKAIDQIGGTFVSVDGLPSLHDLNPSTQEIRRNISFGRASPSRIRGGSGFLYI